MKKSLLKLIGAMAVVAMINTSCSGSKSMPSIGNLNLSSLMGMVSSNPDLTTLLSLVQVAGLGDMLGGSNMLTLLAPNNNAFSNLGGDAVQNLLNNKGAAADLLNNHIIKGSSDLGRLTEAGEVNNMVNSALNFTQDGGSTQVNGANILSSLKTDNGYAHILDGVLGL